MTEKERTPREKQILNEMRRKLGEEEVEEKGELILAQARLVGEI
jgi:hypothetical protein